MTQATYRSFKNLLSGSWEATTQERARFFAFIALFVTANLIDLATPWAMGYVLGVFVNGFNDEAFRKASIWLLVYIGLRLFYTGAHHCARYLQNTVAYTARMSTIAKIFDGILRFPLRWHVNHHSGENLSRLQRSVGAVDQTIGTYVWQVIEGLTKFVFAALALFALDLSVALFVMALGIFTVLMMIFFNKQLVRNIRANNAFYDKLNRTCVDYLFNIITVKTLKLEGAANRKLHEHQPKGLQISKTISAFQELKWGSVGLGYALVLGGSLMIYFHGHRGFQGAFNIAQVYVLINYLERIFAAIGSFTGYYSGLIEASTAYEDGNVILEEARTLPQEVGKRRIPEGWEVLGLKQLEFSYVRGEHAGIAGIHLDLKRGDKIAIVGPSGGGKSTLLKILAGMIPPERCAVEVAGRSDYTIDDVGQISLLLPQEPEIFSESVRYNLTLGESFRPEELQFFVSLCKVEGIIAKLPKGWESDLAEKGLNLSVGEKQRVAMARGLLRASSKDILLLDEPTSSLDPMTEKAIFYGLLYHFADRTVITACHRLALVPLFDKIVYIRQGRIEEAGSFKELIDKRGLFYYAWEDYEKKVVREQEPHLA